MTRRISLALLASCILVGACSRASTTPDPRRTDAAGNPIAKGYDWSAGKPGATPRPNPYANLTSETALDRLKKCGVPPTLSPEQKEDFPAGADPDKPFGEPQNDFLLRATVTPSKGDRGTVLTIEASAVGQPNALIVVYTRYFDQNPHGTQAAKVADTLGRATFKGPIPNDAPVGVATIAVSASTRENTSAIKMLKFTVTGPGCP